MGLENLSREGAIGLPSRPAYPALRLTSIIAAAMAGLARRAGRELDLWAAAMAP